MVTIEATLLVTIVAGADAAAFRVAGPTADLTTWRAAKEGRSMMLRANRKTGRSSQPSRAVGHSAITLAAARDKRLS